MSPATTPQDGGQTTTPITITTELQTDPVGVELTATVGDGLPRPAQESLLADTRQRLVGQQNNLIFQSVRVAHGALRSYGQRNDYAVEPITESVAIQRVEESPNTLTVAWAWEHEAAQYFQFGVSPHTIDGDPILSFIWEDAPQGVREMFSNTERVGGDPRVFFRSVDHPGIPDSRYVQAGMNWLRQELS